MSGREWEAIAVVLIFVLGPGLGLRFEAMERSTIPVALDHVVLSNVGGHQKARIMLCST